MGTAPRRSLAGIMPDPSTSRQHGPGRVSGRMPRMPGRLVRGAALGVVVLGAAGIAWSATGGGSNVVGPSTRIQPTGRQLDPVGKLTKLGNFPTGGALTPNGRFLWTLSTGRGINDIRIVEVTGDHAGRVVQKIRMPGSERRDRDQPRRPASLRVGHRELAVHRPEPPRPASRAARATSSRSSSSSPSRATRSATARSRCRRRPAPLPTRRSHPRRRPRCRGPATSP